MISRIHSQIWHRLLTLAQAGPMQLWKNVHTWNSAVTIVILIAQLCGNVCGRPVTWFKTWFLEYVPRHSYTGMVLSAKPGAVNLVLRLLYRNGLNLSFWLNSKLSAFHRKFI